MSTSVLHSKTIIAKDDSAATTHYWRPQDAVFKKNIQPYSGPPEALPDDDTISPINQGILSLSHSLSKTVQIAMTLRVLRISSLINTCRSSKGPSHSQFLEGPVLE